MAAILMNKFPEFQTMIKEQMEHYVETVERHTHSDPGTMWYRFFRPNDPGIGGTQYTYSASYTNATEMHILGVAAITVPVSNAYVSFGWYVDVDLGDNGYLLVKKQTVTKDELKGRVPYEQQEPRHLYLDFNCVVFSEEQDIVDYVTYNDFGAAQIGICIPFMFRIASKEALNLL